MLIALSTYIPLSLHGQIRVDLPKQVVVILDSKYPNWHLVDNLKIIESPVLQGLDLDTTKCRPNFVWGDFDGNGKRDYIVFIERQVDSHSREQFLLAFIAKGSNFQKFLLDQASGDAYIAEYIWLAKKGSMSYDFENDKEFVLKRDAVELIVIEKGSDLLYFDKGQFKRITTSD